MNARPIIDHPAIVPAIQSPVEAVTRAEALAASLGSYRPQVRHHVGSLIERAAEATATYQALTAPVEDYEAPLYEPPYPEPEIALDLRYRANVMGVLIAGGLLFVAGVIWLISLLWLAFT